MKIKKKTGYLMFAAAAAAITGVSAVSFAAWTDSNDAWRAQAQTGSAYLFGFTTAPEEVDLGKIVPYDQADKTIEEGVKIVSVKVPDFTVYENYTITVASDTELAFYAYIGDEQTAVPQGWTDSNIGDWQRVTANGAVFSGEFTATEDEKAIVVNDKYISFMFVSDDSAQMNSDPIYFDITLATVAA